MTGIDYQLDNWRRHYCDRYARRVTQSLEGRYKPEAGDVLEQDLPTPSLPVNVKQALQVEKLVIKLPHKNKLCLVATYMYPYALTNNSFYRFCRVAAIKPNQYETILQKAKLMIANNL